MEKRTSGTTLCNESLFDQSWKRTWNVNRLTALCRDPTGLFVYWDVSDLRKSLISEHFQSDWTSLPFYLQLYDVTDIEFNGYNAPTTRIGVHPSADNWYLHHLEPNRRYQLDFGTLTWNGRFFAILRSNIVETPPLANRSAAPYIRFAPLARFARLTGQTEQPWKAKEVLEAVEAVEAVEPRDVLRHVAPFANPVVRWAESFDGYHVVERKKGRT